jgi:hypothetical protein
MVAPAGTTLHHRIRKTGGISKAEFFAFLIHFGHFPRAMPGRGNLCYFFTDPVSLKNDIIPVFGGV